ncbi:class I SAM-dependent methyltransferase [Hymenobacter oligotrophus]|uniref:Class I SAM-dependent methyltransferase n=1 Tax=Hymenobacter oligotrophus TaxID=2319843 RepID=A0A3B7R7V6_9BACT|nr:class I SAM-dependent methyltransferase [Hymenobacter oligotrophus]AYA37149.1 class I SAM-dependent methyltransferase [Hymenobacter oligotrophus]
MNVQQAYNAWSGSYDTVENKTRDLEARAIRATVPGARVANALELGCGTGKNTEWLAGVAQQLTAVDFSAEMMQQARQKLPLPHITFRQANITEPWHFAADAAFDLISCSLILEHIADLGPVFAEAQRVLRPGGLFYVGELHPVKQYTGSKARFDTGAGQVFELECYVHHVSDFTEAARQHGLRCQRLQEWFDADDRSTPPRIVSFLFEKAG